MRAENLEELIACLTPEELRNFRHLIEECRERRKSIREHTARVSHSLEQVSIDVQTVHEVLRDIERCGRLHTDPMDFLLADLRPLLLSMMRSGPSLN